jgi:hypothetical protein
MSATTPLTTVPPSAGYELAGVGLETQSERTSTWQGLLAIAGLLLTGSLIAVAAGHTPSLLPESIQLGAPAALGGVFRGISLNIHSGGAIAALALMFAFYALAVAASGQLSPRVVLMTIAALHAVILLAPPLVSTDVFSYQAYARMGALYSINPYTHVPYAINFDSVFSYVGEKWSYVSSAYGPVFTVFSYLLASLSIATGVFAYKSIAAVSSIVLVAVVWHCARLRGKDPVKAAVLVGLNPLLVIYGVGGGHNDLLMLLAAVGGVYAILASRERLGGGLTMLAVGIKLTAGLVFPFALVAGGPRRGRGRRDLLIGGGAGLAVIIALGLGVFGWGSLTLFSTVSKAQKEGAWQSLPGFISSRLGMPGVGHVATYVLAAAFLAVCYWLLRRVWHGRMDWIDGSAWAMLAMLVASSSLLPWYVAWLLPFAALGQDRRLVRTAVVFTGVVQAIQLLGYIPHGSGLL